MNEKLKAQVFGWALLEETNLLEAHMDILWRSLRLDEVDPPLAAFAFDTALAVQEGPLVRDWIRKYEHLNPAEAITALEMHRRRRCRVDPNWEVHGPRWTNRITRAKRRAMSLVGPQQDKEVRNVA